MANKLLMNRCVGLSEDSEAVINKTDLPQNWSLYTTEARPGVKVKDVLSFILVHFLRSKKGNCLRRQNFLNKLSKTFRAHVSRVVKHQGRVNMLVRTKHNDMQRRYFKQVFRQELKKTMGKSPALVTRRLEGILVPVFLNIIFGFEETLERELSTEQQDEICTRLGLRISRGMPGLLEAFRHLLQPELTQRIVCDTFVLKLLSSKRQIAFQTRQVQTRVGESEETDAEMLEETPLTYEEGSIADTAEESPEEDVEGGHCASDLAQHWPARWLLGQTFIEWHLSVLDTPAEEAN